MDSNIFQLDKRNYLSECMMILSSADKPSPMLDKRPFKENEVIRTKKYAELSAAKKIQADCDLKATNIILQGLRFAIPVFSPGDDPIACLNKAIDFLTAVASSRFPSTNNQLRTSSNPRNQATIQDGRGNATSSRRNTTSVHARVVKYYICQGEGHMDRQCTQPERPRNAAWYKEKTMLAEAQEARQILDEEQLAFLTDTGIPSDQAQTIILHNAAFQTEDLYTYDSDCDDLLTAQAVLMTNISNYGSDVISKFSENESKEKENKYMENEIDLEKKINELDNIICKAELCAGKRKSVFNLELFMILEFVMLIVDSKNLLDKFSLRISQSRQHDKSESDSYYLLIMSSIHLLDLYRYPVDTSLIHIESRKSPTAVLFDDDTGRTSIRHCEY
ncbi:hypothetical protein Tco_0273186 [Tanacetum coccineum]